MILIQGQLGKVKVTGKKSIKLVSSPYLFFFKTWKFLLKTKKKKYLWLGPCHDLSKGHLGYV